MAPQAGTGAAALSVLGFDVGSRRIGVAVGNTLSASARALEVVPVTEAGPDWSRIDALVRDYAPAALVVGEPLTLDGAVQAATQRARAFASEAGRRYQLPTPLVDERSSSREADRRFAQARRLGAARRRDAADLDALAAQIILERWLQQSA